MYPKLELMSALHHVLRPFLEQHKFKARRPIREQDERNKILCPVYRIRRKVCIHTMDVQYDSFSTWFCVNMGVHFRFLPCTFNEELPKPNMMDSAMCIFTQRLSPDAGDHWWQVFESRDATFESVHDATRVLSESGLAFFDAYGNLPGPYASISVASLDSGEYKAFMPRTSIACSPVRIASMMAYISKHFGKNEASKEFAQYAKKSLDLVYLD